MTAAPSWRHDASPPKGRQFLRFGALPRRRVWLAGQNVEVVCEGGLVQIHHRGVLYRERHARRHDQPSSPLGGPAGGRGKEPQARPTASVVTVTRKVDSSGNVSFSRCLPPIRAGNKFRHRQVQVAVSGEHLEISIGEQLIRRHKIKHDRTPANMVPSPTPVAGHAESTPPEPNPTQSTSYRSPRVTKRVPRGLTVRGVGRPTRAPLASRRVGADIDGASRLEVRRLSPGRRPLPQAPPCRPLVLVRDRTA